MYIYMYIYNVIDMNIGRFRIWLHFQAKCRFKLGGGGGFQAPEQAEASTGGNLRASGWDLDGFGSKNGYPEVAIVEAKHDALILSTSNMLRNLVPKLLSLLQLTTFPAAFWKLSFNWGDW